VLVKIRACGICGTDTLFISMDGPAVVAVHKQPVPAPPTRPSWRST